MSFQDANKRINEFIAKSEYGKDIPTLSIAERYKMELKSLDRFAKAVSGEEPLIYEPIPCESAIAKDVDVFERMEKAEKVCAEILNDPDVWREEIKRLDSKIECLRLNMKVNGHDFHDLIACCQETKRLIESKIKTIEYFNRRENENSANHNDI